MISKHVAAALLPLASILSASTARADSASDPAAKTNAPAAATSAQAPDAPPAGKSTKAADYTIATGTWVFVSSYVFGIAVSLSADQACQGSICKERYLSFVPVAGGVLQFAMAGKSFHDAHHSDNCFPLTVADVGGQALGAIGIATGLVMRYVTHRSGPGNVNVTPTYDHGPGMAVSVSL